MGLFSRKAKEQNKPARHLNSLPWIELTSIEQLMEVLSTTEEKPVLLFKHSTRCSISMMALNSFQSKWTSGDDLCGLYFLDLLNHRDVSNEIAVLTGVIHQSPQVIVLKGKEIIYDASHSSIDARRIEAILRKG